MIRAFICRVSVPVLCALAPLAIVGCSAGDSPSENVASTGTLTLPLVTSANGHTYRLSAQIEISGPTFLFLDASGDQTVLTTPLPTGNYFVQLFSFGLERLDDSGVFQPVSATLISSPFQQFVIYNGADTTVSFQFQTDGAVVTTGTGRLNVTVGVSETAPVCTILGSDCPDGSWCPPSGLTGQPLACVFAGGVALGGPCVSPTDCQANASCYDFGAGPQCTALCSSADVGNACAAGGTCTTAAADYGVCVPNGDTLPDGGAGGAGGAGPDGGFPAGAAGK